MAANALKIILTAVAECLISFVILRKPGIDCRADLGEPEDVDEGIALHDDNFPPHAGFEGLKA